MPKEAYAQGGAYAQKAYAQRLMPKQELMPKTGLMPNETACESSQMPAVAPPGETAPDLFPVSRAKRKILSPFGVPLMYSLRGPLGLGWVNLG